jgi:hypothetical protein
MDEEKCNTLIGQTLKFIDLLDGHTIYFMITDCKIKEDVFIDGLYLHSELTIPDQDSFFWHDINKIKYRFCEVVDNPELTMILNLL